MTGARIPRKRQKSSGTGSSKEALYCLSGSKELLITQSYSIVLSHAGFKDCMVVICTAVGSNVQWLSNADFAAFGTV